MNDNPIVIVEDDKDDCELLTRALSNIGIPNEFRCFDSPVKALEYLKSTKEKTFLIISDVNMPFMSGLEFKQSINNDKRLNEKQIPFVFLSTSGSAPLVDKAFQLCIQGYFQKPNSMPDLNNVAKAIITYWKSSKLPHTIN